MVVEDPNFWELSELRQRAETLFNQSETALERGRARMLVSKIARFEDIKRRKQALAAVRPELARPDPPAVSPLPPADPDGRFDAKGQLIRVPNPKPGGPQYAILDATRQHSLLRLARPRREPAELCRPAGRHQRHPRIHARAEGQPRDGAARERGRRDRN